MASASGLNTPTVGLIHADNAYKPIEEHLFFSCGAYQLYNIDSMDYGSSKVKKCLYTKMAIESVR